MEKDIKDNWHALFDLSPRFTLDITGSPLRPDVLHIKGREALSEPFRCTIDFTVPPGDIAPGQLLLKYASLKMHSGRTAHGRLTALERLAVSADLPADRGRQSGIWHGGNLPAPGGEDV